MSKYEMKLFTCIHGFSFLTESALPEELVVRRVPIKMTRSQKLVFRTDTEINIKEVEKRSVRNEKHMIYALLDITINWPKCRLREALGQRASRFASSLTMMTGVGRRSRPVMTLSTGEQSSVGTRTSSRSASWSPSMMPSLSALM